MIMSAFFAEEKALCRSEISLVHGAVCLVVAVFLDREIEVLLAYRNLFSGILLVIELAEKKKHLDNELVKMAIDESVLLECGQECLVGYYYRMTEIISVMNEDRLTPLEETVL